MSNTCRHTSVECIAGAIGYPVIRTHSRSHFKLLFCLCLAFTSTLPAPHFIARNTVQGAKRLSHHAQIPATYIKYIRSLLARSFASTHSNKTRINTRHNGPASILNKSDTYRPCNSLSHPYLKTMRLLSGDPIRHLNSARRSVSATVQSTLGCLSFSKTIHRPMATHSISQF